MRHLALALPLALLTLSTPAMAIFIDFTGGGVWDHTDPTGWTDPEPLAEVSGTTFSGEYPNDVSAKCASVSWAQAGVHSVKWAGAPGVGAWTVYIGGRGYNTGVLKSGSCGIFIDFTGGGYSEPLPVSFE